MTFLTVPVHCRLLDPRFDLGFGVRFPSTIVLLSYAREWHRSNVGSHLSPKFASGCQLCCLVPRSWPFVRLRVAPQPWHLLPSSFDIPSDAGAPRRGLWVAATRVVSG